MPQLTNLSKDARIAKRLQQLSQNIPQTLLFEGPEETGKEKDARAFAKMVLQSEKKNSPDFREFFPEESSHMHSIQTIRDFIKDSAMPPLESQYRVFLIHDIEHMLAISMNALLKTLEEPPPTTIIILLTSHFQDLPSTITSRCFTLSFTSAENVDSFTEVKQSIAESIFNVGIHLVNRKYPIPQEYEKLQNEEEILLYLSLFYRDLYLLKTGGDPSYLFYKDKEKTLRDHLSSFVQSLEEVQEKIDRIYRATILNIPLSHSLYILL